MPKLYYKVTKTWYIKAQCFTEAIQIAQNKKYDAVYCRKLNIIKEIIEDAEEPDRI